MRVVNFTFLITLFLGVSSLNKAHAQTSVIVVNGGLFGSTNYANVSIQDMDQGTFKSLDTIRTTSIQDVLVEGENVYVAAKDSIVKINLTTESRVAANKFEGASTKKIALHGSHLLVGNWYLPYGWVGPYNKHFLIYNTSDLSLADSIPEVTKPAADFVVVGDFAYITQNSSTASYSDTLGYLAVVDLTTRSWVRNDTLSTNGDDVGRLVVEGNMIYSINGVSGTISSLNTSTLAKNTVASTATSLSPKSYGPTAFTTGNGVWYFPYNNGIGSYNLSTNTVITPDIVPLSGSFAFTMDTEDEEFYVSLISFGNQSANRGVVYDIQGDSTGTFDVGFSPEAMAIYKKVGVSVSEIAQGEQLDYTIYPNPTISQLHVELAEPENVTLMILNQAGQIVQKTQSSAQQRIQIGVEELATGMYYIAVVNQDGILRTKPFVKK